MTAGSFVAEHSIAGVNGVDLHYAYRGRGPLIVFPHGFLQFHYALRAQLREFGSDLSAQDARIAGS